MIYPSKAHNLAIRNGSYRRERTVFAVLMALTVQRTVRRGRNRLCEGASCV
jgi:hypothetical protein